MLLLGTTGWAVLAVYYTDLAGGSPRAIPAGVYAAAALACVIFIRPRRYGALACFAMFAMAVLWFFSRTPSNNRDWRPETASLPSAEIVGDRVTIHNVRNFDYKTETDFAPRWETRTYDLSKLRTVDAMLVYWGSPAIAHAMVSFGFDGDQYLAVSIEARMQQSESYSTVQGFFRQFELVYIFSDERDVIRLRTNYRHEDVYLYRSTFTPEQARELLLGYLEHANQLAREPQFYNAATSNCATNVLENAKSVNLPAHMSWKILFSGYAAEQMYANHRIDTSLPYEELVARSHVNDAANKADQDPNFSLRIREGLPMPTAVQPN
ncbi:MAG: DUF4105 domain-containing protein [Planctomycetes bacterium]|nr:DUF4105 domain-containing protein [Planctomycetota bacterium]